MAESKKFWPQFFVGLAATTAAALIVILLLAVFRGGHGEGPRAATRLFLKRLLSGQAAVGFTRPDGSRLKNRWEIIARRGVLDNELQAGDRAAVYVIVPADQVPGMDLGSIKRRLTALDRRLARAGATASRVDLIGRARREAERGRLLFFIKLYRERKTWRVDYPLGLVLVGG
jgi:hypothetical protein